LINFVKIIIIRILKKIAVVLLIITASVPIGAYLALQIPALQTWSARKAAGSLSRKLQSEVSIGKVYYVFFNKLIVNDIAILYSDKDTLLGCGKLSVKFSASDLLRGKLKISHAHLYDGVFNLVNITDSTTSLDRVLSTLSSGEKSDSTTSIPDIFAGEIKLRNFRFHMHNPFNDLNVTDSGVINFNNLAVRDINTDIRKIQIHNDTLKAIINNISFAEKSGFKVNAFSGNLSISNKIAKLDNLIIDDGYSKLNARSLSFNYNNSEDFSNFLTNVRIEADFNNTLLNFQTLSKFAAELRENRLVVYIDGVVSGPVSNLKANDLRIRSETGLTYADLNFSISGLPDTDVTMAFIDIKNSTTTTLDLAYIISSLNSSKPIKELANLSPFVKYNFKGRLAGLLNDFVANGNLTSNIGNVYMDVLLRTNSGKKGVDLRGNIRTDKLNIGKLIKNNSLGEITLESKITALLRDQDSGGSEFYIDNLNVKELQFNGYPYRNIYAAGSYLDDTFDGKVIFRDPNLDLIFQGIIGVKSNYSYYDFYADVVYADLAALNFDKRDSVSSVSLRTLANFTRNSKGDIDGTINVKSLNFKNSNGNFPIGDITVQSSSRENNFTLFLRSAFADATYRGDDFFTNFIDKYLDIVLHSNLSAIFPEERDNTLRNNKKKYSLSVEFNDTKAISQLLLPGLSISKGTTLRFEIDSKERLTTEIKSERTGYKGIYSNKLNLNLSGDARALNANITSDRIHLAGINLDSSKLSLNLRDNLLKIRSEYTNKGDLENRLDFTSEVLFTPIGEGKNYITDISISPSEILLNGENWSFAKSKIVKQENTYVFHDFNLFRSDQFLNIDGIISSNELDTLSVVLNNIDISPVNSFIREELNIQGRLSGNALLLDLYKNPQILLNLKGREISANNQPLGELDILSEWDNSSEHFVIRVLNTLNGQQPLITEGYYKPKGSYLEVNATLSKFSPAFFEPFLADIISRTSGGISGSLLLKGPTDKLVLTGRNTTLDNLAFRVDFTNVNYTLNGPITVAERGVFFNNVAITDRAGNNGRVTGGLQYSHFKNITLNTIINFTNLEALNTREEDNSDFYGKAYGTGRISITGPLEKILMDISLTSNKNTSIHIPLSSATNVSSKNLLTFTEPAKNSGDFQDIFADIIPTRTPSELQVKLRANMTPDAAMLIEIDKSVGDIITGYGSGLITLDINPSRDIFSIQGDYVIQSGSYKFVLQGFIERDFTIQEGGNIGFNGDINRTNLNITANYRTKAAVNTLISDTSSVANRRTVDCQIRMTGPLMNPRLSFDIDIPDIDPITKARVNAALNTDDKIVKQVMSLLVSGSFIPDVQSSIVNNSTILYSNATEVLSNQINKIFNQLDIPLDLSFNYQPGQNGRDLFDAAVSAQLFNNRVIVNGNIGSSKHLNKSGDVVGDLDVEIKLDEKGRFRAKAFSHSADQYSNYLDNSQRNGVGLVYQEEFSSLRELLDNLFNRKKREQRRVQKQRSILKPEEINLEISY